MTTIEDMQKQMTVLINKRERIRSEIDRVTMELRFDFDKTEDEIETIKKDICVAKLAEYGLKVGDKLLCTDRYKTYSNAVARRFTPFDYALVKGADSTDERVWIDAYDNDREWPSWGHVVPVDIAKGMRQAWIQEHGDE